MNTVRSRRENIFTTVLSFPSNKTVSKLKSFYLQAFGTVRPLTTTNNNNDNEKQETIAVHPAGR